MDWTRLDEYLARWDGGAALKRLGYLADVLSLHIPERIQRLERWQGMLSKGISPLEPGAGDNGPVVTKWRVRVNVSVDTLEGEGQ